MTRETLSDFITAATSPPLALTMGDPSGIGAEITLAAWLARLERALPPFAVYACPKLLADRARLLGLDVPIAEVSGPDSARQHFATCLPVVPVGLRVAAPPGHPETANAASVLASIERAFAAAIEGRAAAIVTNPIAKSVLYQAGFKHPGHTEYLAALAELHDPDTPHIPVMMLACEELRVVPLTIHIPLAAVPAAVTRQCILATVPIVVSALQTNFAISAPRIAIAGLNPHAGEAGSLGREDVDIIAPAIAQLRCEGFDVRGPLPADTMFHAAARQGYDAAIAMYHDQALIPIKTLAFDRGVNVTLGLPIVRTSPDHGTAFDIAGRGLASPESLIEALKLAAAMAARRRTALRQ